MIIRDARPGQIIQSGYKDHVVHRIVKVRTHDLVAQQVNPDTWEDLPNRKARALQQQTLYAYGIIGDTKQRRRAREDRSAQVAPSEQEWTGDVLEAAGTPGSRPGSVVATSVNREGKGLAELLTEIRDELRELRGVWT